MPPSRLSQLERATAGSPRSGSVESACDSGSSLQDADLLNSVLAHAPLVLWEVDADGIFTLSTGRGLEVLGKPLGEFLGKSAYEHFLEYPAILNDIRRALAGDEHRSLVEIGSIFFDSWYTPLRDVEGKILGVRGVATVITQQKRAEQELQQSQQALQESQNRFAKAFHSSPLGIMFTRLENGEFIDVNDAFERISGYSRYELIGRTAADLNRWASSAERERFVQSLRENGRVRDSEYKFRNKQGEQVIGRVSAEMVELNGTSCVLSICEDVTEQKKVENAVREGERRFQTLARIAPVGIFHTDAAGDCLYVNEHFCSVSGLTLLDAAGSGWARALHPDDREEVIAAWQEAVEQRVAFRREFRMQRPDGVVTWVLVQAMPERNDSGEVTSYVGTVTGIDDFKQIEQAQHALNLELTSRIRERTHELSRTGMTLQEQIAERKRVLEDLLQSQARWKSVVEDAPDFILIVDRRAIIRYINRTIPPLKKSDVEGKNVFDFIPAEYHEQVREELNSIFETGKPTTSELSALGPNGSQAWYSSRIGPVKVDDVVVAASIVARDITQQVQVEEEMRRRQADWAHVSRLNTMGELAATLAHELNQPLSAISNYAGGCAVRLQAGPVDPDELIAAAQTISRQANRASETIGRILDFVRKKDMAHEEVCLNGLVADTVGLALPEAKQQGVLIQVETDPNLPCITGDRIQIEQVLLNLIVNAIDAVKENSTGDRFITVTTSTPSTDQVQISVSDNGCGLPADFDEWGFEPFQSSKPQGLGMGLSISRSIIDSHKGRLWAVVCEDGGATFYVSLPSTQGDHKDE